MSVPSLRPAGPGPSPAPSLDGAGLARLHDTFRQLVTELERPSHRETRRAQLIDVQERARTELDTGRPDPLCLAYLGSAPQLDLDGALSDGDLTIACSLVQGWLESVVQGTKLAAAVRHVPFPRNRSER